MEIDITSFFHDAEPSYYSASRAELGDNAAQLTWNASLDAASENSAWLADSEARMIFRDYLAGFGAWSRAEIAAYTTRELTALLTQMIAGDMREGGLDSCEPDWDEYTQGAEAGTYSGRIYRGDNGRIYYYVGD